MGLRDTSLVPYLEMAVVVWQPSRFSLLSFHSFVCMEVGATLQLIRIVLLNLWKLTSYKLNWTSVENMTSRVNGRGRSTTYLALRKLLFRSTSYWMEHNRSDNFTFNFEPNGIPFGSRSKGKLSPRLYIFQYERKWKYSFSVSQGWTIPFPLPRDVNGSGEHYSNGPTLWAWIPIHFAIRECNACTQSLDGVAI